METRALIDALRDGRAYPRPAANIEVLQTHVSVLFFAGDLVYKVKKPVNLGFLDFSTLEQRREACAEEVRLNAALAPGVYRRVVPITRGSAVGGLWIDGTGDVLEYAVEMTRLPADRMLDRMLAAGDPLPGLIDRIVAVLAKFHADADSGPEVSRHGTPERVRRKIERNLAQVSGFAGEVHASPGAASPTLSLVLLRHLRAWSDGALRERHALLASRVPAGRIREGHGDLHAGNICLTNGDLIIYDRIEFDASLRCGDAAAELAFLAMDLDRRGRRDLSRALVESYSARTRDPDLPRLQDLYRSHFACVRGKVASIRAREHEVDARDRLEAWAEAAGYFHLAAGYTLPPALILMCGLPGTGKSWAARYLAAPLGADVIASDRVRKELAGIAATGRWHGAHGTGPYTAEMTDRTYGAMLERSAAVLAEGRSVIADATFATRALRAPFIDLARARRTPLAVVHLAAPPEVIRNRMAARARDPAEVSDADLAVHEAARDRFEPPEGHRAERVIASGPVAIPEPLVQRVLDMLVAQADNAAERASDS